MISLSSGPCSKFPDWTPFESKLLGRSHRSDECIAFIQMVFELTKNVLNIPKNYKILMVSGSTTGATEAAMWNMLGPRQVDIISYEVFGERWYDNVVHHLGFKNVRHISSKLYIQDIQVKKENDVIFVWNGTSTGAKIADTEWIADDREGLVISDLASAAFTENIDWSKIDVGTFSFQKGMGGEAGLGFLVINDRAEERLKTYKPNWPIPRIIRISDDHLRDQLAEGYAINTISIMGLVDFYGSLMWAIENGGHDFLMKKTQENYDAVMNWLEYNPKFKHLIEQDRCRAKTPVCITYSDNDFLAQDWHTQWHEFRRYHTFLREKFGDILNHPASNPGIRIWTGPTVKTEWILEFLEEVRQIKR